MKRTVLALGGTLLLILCVGLMAQPGPGGDQGGGRRRGGPPGGGNFDPAQFQERMLEMMKERLAASDQEWSVIKPLLSDVMAKRRSGGGFDRGMMFGRGGGPGGDRGGNDDQRRQQRMQEMQRDNPEGYALMQALENQQTPAAEIKTKLDAYRAAQKKKADELKAAQDKLKGVLTQRQEAQLVLMGYIE